jgi:hypothetical protein
MALQNYNFFFEIRDQIVVINLDMVLIGKSEAIGGRDGVRGRKEHIPFFILTARLTN